MGVYEWGESVWLCVCGCTCVRVGSDAQDVDVDARVLQGFALNVL